MTDEQIDGYYIEAIDPRTGQVFNLIVRHGKREMIRRHGIGRARELAELVPRVVRHPRKVFGGLRRRSARDWLCYIGTPDHAIDLQNGQRIPAWPGMVFVVFANARRIIYTWGWESADPECSFLPEDFKNRFTEPLL